jgi:ferredoxin
VELEAEGDLRLLDLIDEARFVAFPLSCRGAHCGVCRVHVLRGAEHLTEAAPAERETLARLQADADDRLACQLWLRDKSSGELVLRLSLADVPGESKQAVSDSCAGTSAQDDSEDRSPARGAST